MKKRIIYGIGSTASSIIGELKTLNDSTFNNDTIYKIWDVDNATYRVENLVESEIKIFTESDIRSRLKRIKADKHNNAEIYEDIEEVFPINDEELINSIPITNAQGAAKKPIISRLISQMYLTEIRNAVDTDCTDFRDNTKEAFVVMSTCGGTSTGLNVEIIAELLRNKCTIYLFFLTPGYFFRVDNTTDFKANTVASLLRIYHDLEKKSMFYVDDKVDFNSLIYPFIIESEWTEGNFAEYNLGVGNRVDRNLFVQYNAKALKGFLIQHNEAQNFGSRINNELSNIEENKEYFNVLLLYPNFQYKQDLINVLHNEYKKTNGNIGKENLLKTLQKEQPQLTIDAIDNLLLTHPDIVKNKLLSNEFSIQDWSKILNYIYDYYETNRSLWSAKSTSGNMRDDNKGIKDEIDEYAENQKSFWRSLLDYLKNFPNRNDSNEEELYGSNSTDNINPNAIVILFNICKEYIENYKKNKSFIDVEFSPILSENSSELKLQLNGDIFFKDPSELKDYILKSKISETKGLNPETPPILKDQQSPFISYQNNLLINENIYFLRIYSKIPNYAISYLRGDNLGIYHEVKRKMSWCYPDKRLQGIRPFDEDARKFKDWHDKTIKNLGYNITEEAIEKEQVDADLCAWAFICDQLNQLDPNFNPTVDFKKDVNSDGFYLDWVNDGTNRLKGKSFTDIFEVLNSFKEAISQINSPSLFENQVINIDDKLVAICNVAQNQVLSFKDENKLKTAVNAAYKIVIDYKKAYLSMPPQSAKISEEEYLKMNMREQLINNIIVSIADIADLIIAKFNEKNIASFPPKGIQ